VLGEQLAKALEDKAVARDQAERMIVYYQGMTREMHSRHEAQRATFRRELDELAASLGLPPGSGWDALRTRLRHMRRQLIPAEAKRQLMKHMRDLSLSLSSCIELLEEG